MSKVVPIFALLLFCPQLACATTTSPKVPKKAIEKAADTKVPDAGSDAANEGSTASEKP